MNRQTVARRGELLLWDAFEHAARAHGDAVAFVDGADSLTYDELHGQAQAYARRLHELHGAQRALDRGGAVIGLVAVEPRSTVAWILAALSVGASVAPISPFAPDHDAHIRLLQPDLTVTCSGDGVIGPLVLFGRAVRHARRPPAGMIVCTAGTTGAPKAVAHSHVTLAHAVRRLQLFRLESAGGHAAYPADDRALGVDMRAAAVAPALGLRYATTLPLTTMAGLTVAFQALLAGEALVAPPAADPGALLAALADARATNVSLPPLLAQLVLRAARDGRGPRPESLLFVGIGGGPVPPELAATLEAALGCAVAVGYGTTEAGGAVTMGKVSDPPLVRHGTVGRALPGVELSVDPDTQELLVRCASIAPGYVSTRGELTDFATETYATGDIGFLRADGALELGGRTDALILRGGRNIDPARIEHTLEDHPAVRRAGAFGVANRVIAGEQDIWTLVELEHVVAEIELRSHCNRALGASLTPRRIIAVDALPLTADGAVRRHELPRLATSPVHEPWPAVKEAIRP
jgi:long-chain acyl-CoA synthetase